MSPGDCLACDLIEGRSPLPGGVIHDSGRRLVEHCGPGLQVAMFRRGDMPDVPAVQSFADEARAAFARG